MKSVQEAIIQGLQSDAYVLASTLEWRIISETELSNLEPVEGTLVSQGTTDWTINRRSIPPGIYQVKFTASYKIGDPEFPQTLIAFDFGFIEVIAAPVKAIIEGGSSVRWGSIDPVTVDGSLSYDGDIGPGNLTGLSFAWSCLVPGENVSNDCFGSFVGQIDSPTISIDTSKLAIGKTHILKLVAFKDERTSSAEMSFKVAAGKIPQVSLR